MAEITRVDDLGPDVRARADAVIDVRSPAEFAHDHAPGAVNLPVLSDGERARIGTLYVREDSFLARRLGAALVARNIAGHLEGALAGRPGGWRPLVYCWRGGQRSEAMATVLSQVGWRTSLLRGGYRTYRRGVVAALYDAPPLRNLVLLEGGTGVGKTEILARLRAGGAQSIDLEALAEHRGSLLGGLPGRPQPSQKLFESRLAAALAAVDPDRPLVVEAESSKVGEVMLPPVLWTAMSHAPRIVLRAPLDARIRRLVDAYRDGVRDRGAFSEALGRLPRHLSRDDIHRWRGLLAAGDLAPLARELLERHYDPAYARASQRHSRPALGEVCTGTGGVADAARATQAILALLATAPRLENAHDRPGGADAP